MTAGQIGVTAEDRVIEVSVIELRDVLAEVLNQVHYGRKVFRVLRRGRPMVAIVPLDEA